MDAVLETARRLPNARFVITTLGKRGSVMLVRHPQPHTAASSGAAAGAAAGVPVKSLSQVASELEAELEAGGGQGAGEEVDCVSRTGVGIRWAGANRWWGRG